MTKKISILKILCFYMAFLMLAGTVSAAEPDKLPIKRDTSVYADGNYSFAVKSDGSLWTWGVNISMATVEGYAGNGPIYTVPMKIADDIVDIFVTGYVCQAVLGLKSDGSLWLFGGNYTDKYGNIKTKPIKVMNDVINVAGYFMGEIYSLKSDGSLWSFEIKPVYDSIPSKYQDLPIVYPIFGTTEIIGYDYTRPEKRMDGVSSISVGLDHVLVLKSDKTLYSWGFNYFGQLGNGEYQYSYQSDYIDYKNPEKIMKDVISIYAERDKSYAIKSDGSLWAWGKDYLVLDDADKAKQLNRDYTRANTNSYDELLDSNEPVKIMENVSKLYSGFLGQNYVIKTDGSLWAWSAISRENISNYYYNLNYNKKENIIELPFIPTKILDKVLDVKSQGKCSFAVRSDGSLWAWGYSSAGQMGNGLLISKFEKPIKIMDNVVQIAVGTAHTLVVKSDGSLWAWGNNNKGQLGNGKYYKEDIIAPSDHYIDGIDSDVPIKIMSAGSIATPKTASAEVAAP